MSNACGGTVITIHCAKFGHFRFPSPRRPAYDRGMNGTGLRIVWVVCFFAFIIGGAVLPELVEVQLGHWKWIILIVWGVPFFWLAGLLGRWTREADETASAQRDVGHFDLGER